MNLKAAVKHTYKYPVVTATEIRLLLKYCNAIENHEYSLIISIMAVLGLRPVEILKLKWSNFKYDENLKKFTEITYLNYKPRRMKNQQSETRMYKAIRKPIYSEVLSDMLWQHYSENFKNSANDNLFQIRHEGAIRTIFRHLREHSKKHNIKELKFLFDTTTEGLFGNRMKIYRVSPYALRRFNFSMMLEIYFHRDIVKLSKFWCVHNRVGTTLDSYLYHKEAIGIDKEYKDVDEFLFNNEHVQTEILEFYDNDIKPRIILNQSSLLNFIN